MTLYGDNHFRYRIVTEDDSVLFSTAYLRIAETYLTDALNQGVDAYLTDIEE